VDETPREFLIYVPDGYDPNKPTPVVFMFHGSNQGGPLMYMNTGWAVKADAEDFIVVYPTSWKYRLLDETGLHEKWNTASMFKQVVPGTELKDDVKFVRMMIAALEATFNVDTSRLYATGFSNGGAFVLTRLMFEMNTIFAAFGTAGAGMFADTELAGRQLPTGINTSLYSVLGTQDEKVSEGLDYTLPFPSVAEDIAADPLLSQMISNTTTILSLDTSYTAEYQRPAFVTLTFNTSRVGAGNQYIFRMINNMGHVYPSGDNNRAKVNAADDFWDFFSLYTINH
jgi:polyhydroxybutyrate depolymerase